MKHAIEIAENALAAQKDRLILWTPVFFAAGVASYFGLRFEPPLWISGGLFAVITAFWLWSRPLLRHEDGLRHFLWLLFCVLFLAAGGFMAAQARTHMLGTVMLDKPVGPVNVEGTIREIDQLEPGQGIRLVLEDLKIEKLPPEKTPQRVRLRVRKSPDLTAGQRIDVLARLNPPAPPAAPGAFDFQRYAYFKRIGAFGFSYDTPTVVSETATSAAVWKKIEDLRRAINDKIVKNSSFPEAGVMIALITGEMTAVSEDDWDAMRVSGLAHMLSISGMHIGIVAGVLFFFSRFFMALFPAFVLRHPIKKYAAGFAFAGALFYTFIAGAPVPTMRAMMMTGVALFAIMIDRMPFSLRTVALAAFAVLLFWPDALWGASFQMSFAAVTALIAFFEALKPHLSRWYAHAGFMRRAALYFIGVCITTLVASAAVDPLSLYHFQQVGLYSIPANMAAAPVMSFVIMPAAVLACFLMPLGMGAEHWPLQVMAWGVRFIMDVAHETASWPLAALLVRAIPLSALLWAVAGALILMFWNGRGKIACVLPFIVALIIGVTYSTPDILVSSNSKLMTVKGKGGAYFLSSRTADRFSGETWLRRNGQDTESGPAPKWPVEGSTEDLPEMICGEGGCRMERNGIKVAFSFAPYTQHEDCTWADILIAQDPVKIRPCASKTIIDRFDTWRNGTYALWLEGRIESVGAMRGARPWTVSNRR